MGTPGRSALLALVLLVGCHKAGEAPCSAAQQKADILAMARDCYLWNAELPAAVDPGAYAGPAELLSALTARPRAEGKDRGFTYLTTRSATTAFFDEGRTLGYGFGYVVRDGRLVICQVFPSSAAAAAGFRRGDEVVAVASSQAGLGDPASQGPALVASGTLPSLLQSSVEGTTRWFRLARAGAVSDVSATTAAYGLDPVPASAAPPLLAAGSRKVGYLALRTFIEPATPLLRQAMAALKAAGATDLIVDLRYNGGGRLTVAETLANLLSPGRSAADVMYRLQWNDRHPEFSADTHFSRETDALAPGRVAFIVTGSSASASELVPNALQAWMGADVALVGDRTYGKPVGQIGYGASECGWLMEMVSFQILNARGTGSYFGGLPDADWTGASIAAQDDLDHEPGDPAEASTAAALAWIATGEVPAPIPAASARRTTAPPRPEGTEIQRALPGVF